MELNVSNMKGEVVGKVAVDQEALLGKRVSSAVVHEVVRGYLANDRAGSADTKGRGEVSGGGKKPWKQKHTGNARHGSIREPQWRHGGSVFGPSPRDYSYELPKKMKKQALSSALSVRLKEGKVIVLDKIELPKGKPSTK